MAQVNIELNGRNYRITCDDGQEARLQELAAYFNRHVTELADELGQIGDARLLLLSALTVCDELFETRAQIAENEEARGPLDPDTAGAASRAIEAAAARVQEMTERLEEA